MIVSYNSSERRRIVYAFFIEKRGTMLLCYKYFCYSFLLFYCTDSNSYFGFRSLFQISRTISWFYICKLLPYIYQVDDIIYTFFSTHSHKTGTGFFLQSKLVLLDPDIRHMEQKCNKKINQDKKEKKEEEHKKIKKLFSRLLSQSSQHSLISTLSLSKTSYSHQHLSPAIGTISAIIIALLHCYTTALSFSLSLSVISTVSSS